MTRFGMTVSRSALTSFLTFGAISAATLNGDLSKYRDFQLGADLPTIARQIGANPSDAKIIHSRPVLIQELVWHPQPLGSSSTPEPVQEVVFTFYGGELFNIIVNYDRSETEGLTAGDIVDAISATYGTATRPAAPVRSTQQRYGDQEEVLAQWQDPQYRFDLISSSYGSGFKLVGVLKRLEAPAQAAVLESAKLDDKEAPQREADRIKSEGEAARTKLEKARLVNKPKFRP